MEDIKDPEIMLGEIISSIMKKEEIINNHGKKLIKESGVLEIFEQITEAINSLLNQEDKRGQFLAEKLISAAKDYYQKTGPVLKIDEIKKITLVESDPFDSFYSLIMLVTFKRIYGQGEVKFHAVVANVYPNSNAVTIYRPDVEQEFEFFQNEPKEKIFRQVVSIILTGKMS